MCQILPSLVISVTGTQIEVELFNQEHVTVDASLATPVSVGDYVLVDRGLVVDVISAGEAQAILAIYEQMGELLAAEDAVE